MKEERKKEERNETEGKMGRWGGPWAGDRALKEKGREVHAGQPAF